MDIDWYINVTSIDNELDCGEGKLWGPPLVESFRYFCDGILIIIIGLIGVIGNVISVLVLLRPKLRDCFHQLLIGLAFFDTVYIVCGGINYTVRAFDIRFDIYTIAFPHFFYPLANIGLCGTVLMTVAISLERFLGICYPLHLPARNRKSWFYLLPVFVISIMVNIPKFLESEVVWLSEESAIESLKEENPNVTLENIPRWIPTNQPTNLRRSKPYITYYIVYFRMFFIGIIPLVMMVFLNLRILMDVGSAVKVKRFGSRRRWRSEMNLFIILLCIVITFLCCHIPRILIDIYEFSHLEDVFQCNELKKYNPDLSYLPPTWVECLSLVSHSMGVLNSSVNFIIYCFVGHTFRKEFFSMFGPLHCQYNVPRRKSDTGFGGTTSGSYEDQLKTPNLHKHSDLEEKQKMTIIS